MGMILSGEITSALTTFAGLGLALILEGDAAERVRLGWTDAAEPQMVVTADGYDDEAIAAAVHEHAMASVVPDSWVQADLESEPWVDKKGRWVAAVMSPRISRPDQGKECKWGYLQERRHSVIDRCWEGGSKWSDLELMGGLGEPSYWWSKGDGGASRWEMKTRQNYQNFVHDRLRGLAEIVADRNVMAIVSGLVGQTVTDEAYKGKRSNDSRTATGLTSPRFTDSALAWCALWGLSSFPVIHRLTGVSVTAGAEPIGEFVPTQLVLPVLVGPHTLDRWRAVVVSEQIIQAATSRESAAAARSACAWLVAHGVRAILTFRVNVSDNDKAPERSLGVGRLEVLT